MKLSAITEIKQDCGDYLILGKNPCEGFQILDQHFNLQDAIKTMLSESHCDQVLVKLVDIDIKENL